MSAIIIKADSNSNKLIKDFARKLGGRVLSIDDGQYEDIALGSQMDKIKTGQTISREDIMKELSVK